MKVVIKTCYGGFGLSTAAYEKLIEYGVPVKAYETRPRDAKGDWTDENPNKGEVLFDRLLTDKHEDVKFYGQYWDAFLEENRVHPLLVRVVEELGDEASGHFSKLKVVEIPDDIQWEIHEYDGMETIEEVHRTWG